MLNRRLFLFGTAASLAVATSPDVFIAEPVKSVLTKANVSRERMIWEITMTQTGLDKRPLSELMQPWRVSVGAQRCDAPRGRPIADMDFNSAYTFANILLPEDKMIHVGKNDVMWVEVDGCPGIAAEINLFGRAATETGEWFGISEMHRFDNDGERIILLATQAGVVL